MTRRGVRDFFVLAGAGCLYAALTLLCAARHQPWFDEAQSWLLARDLTPANLILHQMRYEGSPALWPVLLMAMQRLGLGYRDLNYVSAGFGIVGVGLFLWKAPFPPALRVAFPFCYFPLFQFSVIARSYALYLPLLCGVAMVYPRRLSRRAGIYWLLLVLLANVSVHGALIAGVLFAEWLWSAWRSGEARNKRVRFAGCVAMCCALYAFLFYELRFPPDLLTQFVPVPMAVRVLRVVQQIREAFFGGLGGAATKIVGTIGAAAVIGVSARWFWRTGKLGLYAALMTPLLALALVRATYWHAGVLFLVWIFILWLSLDGQARPSWGLIAAVGAVFAVQIAFGFMAVRFQLSSTFSGSRAAAEYLASSGEDRDGLFAVTPEAFAIQPYFNRNLFLRQEHGRVPAFYPWTIALNHDALGDIDAQKPDRVIFRLGSVGSDRMLKDVEARGYCEERRFPGSIWWKNAVLEADTFMILKRCGWR